jgi:hypothetical protein
MSKGLKNLQSAARAASRRGRIETDAAVAAAAAAAGNTGYDDDSGVSGIGLTPVDEFDQYSSPAPSPSTINVAHSFASTATQPVYHHQMQAQQTHLHPNVNNFALTAPYSGQYVGQHAYSSSISSDGSLQHPFVSRRGNESA